MYVSPDNVKTSTGTSQNKSDSILHRGAVQIALQRMATMNVPECCQTIGKILLESGPVLVPAGSA